MLDQSFSADNFLKIVDIANRKGIHVEDELSMSAIRNINIEIRDCNRAIKIVKEEGDVESLKELNEAKKLLRERKEIELREELEKVSKTISSKGFKIELQKVLIPGGKALYTTPNTPEQYFALKQIQQNVSRLFGVKQSNRFAIVEQVISILGDQFPKIIIRTDLKDFYENIPHPPILERIHKDNLLTPFSRKILTNIINSFKKLSGTNKGLPRGVGVSAYLAELFMREIDRDLEDIPGVIYYARYVDDIILVITPSPNDTNRDYLNEVKSIIESKHRIRLNLSKTDVFDILTPNQTYDFDYLGYKIIFGTGNVKTKLTSKKIKRYKFRIKATFDQYVREAQFNERTARKFLVKRIRFLTGNTRLKNNKSNLLVGIYYSNIHLTEIDHLDSIDRYLTWQINTHISSANLKERLCRFKFKEGFITKRFSPFTTTELNEITKLWKNRH